MSPLRSSTLIVFLFFFFLSCANNPKQNDIAVSNGAIEVAMGNQVWMAKNFDGVEFRNGDTIPHAKSTEEWESAGKSGRPAWCYYGNDTSMGRKYGRIYNWYAINDPRGFAPRGWHVPSNDEWIALENFLGSSIAGLRLRCETGGNAKDTVSNNRFCALLGGYRGKEGGFSGIQEFTYLASSTERDLKLNDIWGRGIQATDSTIMRCGLYKAHGLYVRLIKD